MLGQLELEATTNKRLELNDIANFDKGFDLPWLQSNVNGKQALSISIYQTGQLSVDNIQRIIYQTQAAINLEPPLKLVLVQDNTLFYENRINLLRDNAVVGLILVFFVLKHL